MTDTVETSIAQIVEAEIRAGRVELPVLPEIATRVQELAARDADAREIVTVIEQEPAFAAAVLRYANSVAYAGLREITDLQQAVTRLGLVAVEQTLLGLAAKNAFVGHDPASERIFRVLWNHSLVTALASRRLATRASGVAPELAFLGGLLHDVGKVVILRCAEGLARKDPERFAFSEAALFEFFDALHCRVGESLFDLWNLPVEIRDVVRKHHDPQFQAPQDLLVAVVAFGNQLAAKLGASLRPDPGKALLDTPAAALLRLDDVRLASLMVDVEDDVERVGGAL